LHAPFRPRTDFRSWSFATRRIRIAERRFRRKAEMPLSSLPCADSRRPGRIDEHVESFIVHGRARPDARLIFILRKNPVGAQRPSC
jgi:hypothetical protein